MEYKVFHIQFLILLFVGLSESFFCNSEGRFENFYDPTCKSYYLCKYDGKSYISSLHSCLHKFDPNAKQCSDTYKCQKPIFTCTSSGYFPDLSDITCTKYYNCLNFFGYYFKLTHFCAKGFQFDPSKKLCLRNYKCEEFLEAPDEPKTTEEISITHAPSFIIETEKNTFQVGVMSSPEIQTETTTNSKETEEIVSESTTFDFNTAHEIDTTPTISLNNELESVSEASSEMSETIKIDEKPSSILSSENGLITSSIVRSTTEEVIKEIECDSVGRFPDYSDIDCMQYFLCSRLHNGTYIKTSYKCPSNSQFDPKMSRCSQTYNCHETILITTTTKGEVSTTENLDTTADEGTPETPTSEIDEITTEKLDTTTFVPQTEEPTSAVTTPNPTEEFVCTTTGRFPNLDDETCRTYFLCSKRQNGSFVRTMYTCQNSFYDPNIKQCSKNYKCPSETSTTIHAWDFSCSEKGRFKNENDANCKSYFLCSQFRNGTFVKTQYHCPKSSIFNGARHMCSDMVSCVR